MIRRTVAQSLILTGWGLLGAAALALALAPGLLWAALAVGGTLCGALAVLTSPVEDDE